ncbi:hypothetical protein PIB30_018977 [Stylosanthes scabra]|uniref:Uncharacterized protein n=1 Tax=Stylosanthes scabra TaxID=79078 RepID=A0ABU6Q8Q6_9FABA|nr:hypothetical protein [Stylosanthes scabra]
MCQGVSLSWDPATIRASLMADAFTISAEVAVILDEDAVINFPSLFRNIAVVAPDPADLQKAPSVLHLRLCLGGECQVTSSCLFLCEFSVLACFC